MSKNAPKENAPSDEVAANAPPKAEPEMAAAGTGAGIGTDDAKAVERLPGLGFLRDVPVNISVEIGRKRLPIGEVLELGPSSVIELDKASGEPLDIRVNGVLVARGEAVVVSDRFGVRLTSLLEPAHLLRSLESA